MKSHLIEFFLCGTIASYCMVRCIKLFPRIVEMAYNTVFVAKERLEVIESLIE